MYYTGENVEQRLMIYTSICNILIQKKMIHDNFIYHIIQGLSLASDVKFSDIFADYVSDLNNPLMQRVMLARSVLEYTPMMFETILREYAAYSLSLGEDA